MKKIFFILKFTQGQLTKIKENILQEMQKTYSS